MKATEVEWMSWQDFAMKYQHPLDTPLSSKSMKYYNLV